VLQKYIKGKLSFVKVRQYRDYVRKVRQIQGFYKSRYANKQSCALLVQRRLRGMVVFRKYTRLAKVKAGNLLITKLQNRRRKIRAIVQWRHINFIQRKATLIQRAVRTHLKKRRVTMNRTRCV
jgi:hypothetical protein